MKELLDKWKEYQATEDYVADQSVSNSIFYSFMEWLERNTNDQ